MRLRRLAATLLVLAVVPIQSTAAQAKPAPKKARVVQADYRTPGIGTPATYGLCSPDVPLDSCVRVVPEPGETWVMIEVSDDSSPHVGFTINQFPKGDSGAVEQSEELGAYCIDTGSPIAIDPDMELQVEPWLIGLPDCPGYASTGTVTFTFRSKP